MRIRILIVLILTLSGEINAQCPDIAKDDVDIVVDQNSNSVLITNRSDINFFEPRILVYNLDNRGYYYDSANEEQIIQVPALQVIISNDRIEIINIVEGDFAVILEYNGCEKEVIGWGHSGFPSSGIRIQ